MQLSISHNRYHRQIRLKELGEEGQRKLLRSKVLVIGAGGLGCPALQYLAGAGIGEIGIIDDDTVSLDNLHRQILFRTSDIGKIKSIAAKAALKAMNPDITITAYPDHLTVSNCLHLFENYDIFIDGSDNFATRYMVNDACVLTGKPLVFGAVSRFEGQVAVFNAYKNGNRGVNYRDLFPEPPKSGEVLNCAETGVLGVLPGLIGVMQAGEAIKMITGIGEPLINKMLSVDLLNNSFFEMELVAHPGSGTFIPATKEAFEKMNYEWLCGNYGDVSEINVDTFKRNLNTEGVVIIDVRENGELPAAADFPHLQMPLSTLAQHLEEIKEETVIFFCQAGMRSKQAAHLLGEFRRNHSKIYSLAGGIQQWIAEKKPGTNG
jgi:molybdopterin/thiamine biosynthesis adenylyltransferase/rhodanese-related sulfurtransferase